MLMVMDRRRSLAAALAALLTCLLAAAGIAQTAPATGSLDEIVVTGERAGPSMWHVHRGDAHVWLLGSLTPLPRGITWRSHQVEQVLDSTAQVLVQKPFEISIPRVLWVLITDRSLLLVTGGKRLKDVMPADLHERFSALRSHYTDDATKWEHYRPIVAALFLQQAAFHQVGLSMRLDLGAALRILAKEKHVRVEEVKMAGTGDMMGALKTLPAAAEKTCVQASLVTIESAMPRLMDRARAWADGDIEKLQNLPVPAEVDECRASLDAGRGAADLITRMRQSWVLSVEKYLQQPGTTIAVVNFDLLLEKGGILEQLRDAGYQIDPP
jgi:uncharacterized protein YbaP (TraB family)